MKQEKLIAGALVAFCAVTAVGSWFTQQPRERKDTAAAGAQVRGLLPRTSAVAQLDIQGMIVDSESGGGFGSSGNTSAQTMLAAIERIREDNPSVVLLNINSPGGTASASQAIFDELMRLKRDNGTKIVASMGDLAASGGYYIACAADTIVANPATLTGSIGVILSTQNVQGLMERIGVSSTAITSGPHKDIASPFKPISPTERRILQGIVDDTYAQFVDAVALGRKMTPAQVRPLADGRIYTGRQAKQVRLVDKLGNYSVAAAEARQLGGLDEAAEIRNYSERGWQDVFGGLLSTRANPLAQVREALAPTTAAAFNKIPLMIYE